MIEILERIKARIIDDAGCEIWQGCTANGHPFIRTKEGGKLVRRIVWHAANGPIPAGKIIRCTCETPNCVSLECLTLTTHGKLAKEMGAIGLMSGQKRSANIAKAKRKNAKLTEQCAREIRQSNETIATLSKRYGIAESNISRVKLGKIWRDFSSPWAGLGAL